MDTTVLREIVAPNGAEKMVHTGKSSDLISETEYFIKTIFKIEKSDSWVYEGQFKTPKLINKEHVFHS